MVIDQRDFMDQIQTIRICLRHLVVQMNGWIFSALKLLKFKVNFHPFFRVYSLSPLIFEIHQFIVIVKFYHG